VGQKPEVEKLVTKRMNLLEEYRGKKVFLTGHTGFKGSWFLLILKQLGADVKGYSLAPKNNRDLYHQINGDDLCDSVIADIRDRERLKKELLDFQPNFVFHLAAQALVIDSYTWPVETYETNVMGSIYLMDALRELKKPCSTVMITTDKVYENFETKDPYPEDARLGGYDPYSNSKACAELAISSYRNSFFNSANITKHQQGIAAARSGNVIGGGDWSDNRLVPDIARSLIKKESIVIRNPIAVRPWQHVLEPLSGYLHLAIALANNKSFHGEPFNFGPQQNNNHSVLNVVQDLAKLLPNFKWKEKPDKENKHPEAGLLKLNCDKALTHLNWHAALTFTETIEFTAEWYRKYYIKPEKIADITSKQISCYMDIVDERLPKRF